ncbi:23S rRNA (uracil(747)-C(5))-methyltransferase RlmC [Cellulomonas edaphi]|uniref:23S rRNA (Uracil(747)-C(5))-methyltransferase RlmC n=1 Tax=Cellulomonas edaphi TaxID=3053468 RepID=A0ABT7SA98_9CELL|nr:23S rRNA (uracil(747)-C(5))-methyltransferase RlmC [Cellulomons edaphi]MDM7832542.1 23S rRNA (uracil(747)-C(5))-methyltransferase RlmC [Cellulomons edaphi]
MQCSYYDAAVCRSCALMGQAYDLQVQGKERHVRRLLPGGVEWLPAVAGPESGFRNKAKMVVGGTSARPTLGILDGAGRGVDLQACGLYPPALSRIFPVLEAFITTARLTPYSVPDRSGELKNVLVTLSPDGELMVRFVLRSQESVARIRKHLPDLGDVAVVSANILAEHKAVVEGPLEIPLTSAQTLRMRVNGIDLHLRPQSFFQTNTEVASAMYRQAAEWVDEADPGSLWDLYCGVGGFALHCASPGRDVTGIEVSAEAIASARTSRDELGLERVRFTAADATAFALGAARPPDLVIVNPPRRGIGPELAGWLESSGVRHVVYSSCNAESLARDLAAMPSLRPTRARLLDMFPQTAHYEVITLLERGHDRLSRPLPVAG